MSMIISVKVTKEILEKSANCWKGDQWNGVKYCAISMAVREIFPYAVTGTCNIGVYDDPDHNDFKMLINLPSKACAFIREFDSKSPAERKLMQPMQFNIEITDWWIDRINIDEVKKILSKSETLELVKEL